jgi:L-phenylalanine/L-methionine N-acetyltransferase
MMDKPSISPQKPTYTIRAAEPADAAAMSALIGSDGVFEGTLQMPYAAVTSRVEFLSKTELTAVRLVAVVQQPETGAELIVGHAGLFNTHTSLRRMHARVLAITVAVDWQGRGVGEQLMSALMDWADNWAGVLRIELTVFADNAQAIKLYERHGFAKEGVMRAFALRDGAYIDALAMARLHPHPVKLVAT